MSRAFGPLQGRPSPSSVSQVWTGLRHLILFLGAGLVGCSPGNGEVSDVSAQEPGSEGRFHSAAQVSGAGDPDRLEFPISVPDASGVSVAFDSPPQRILSLVPSATQALAAIGATDLLVGRTEHDTGADLAHLPSVGGGLNPNMESLILLEPDLVIRFAGESDTVTPLRLDELGITHFAVRLDRIADVFGLLETLGIITERPREASSVVAELNGILAELQDRVRDRPRPRAAYVLGGSPPWVAGPDTFIDELLTIAGGENAFSDLDVLYGPVSLEEFLVREIDILLAPEGAEVPLSDSGIPLARVSVFVEIPGPDLGRAAVELASVLHPEAFR